MKPSETTTLLRELFPIKLPTFLWGPPGIGKSDVVRQVAEQLGAAVVDVRCATIDPVDLRGLPHVEGGIAEWATPGFLPQEAKHGPTGILFLDELAQSPPLVQAACLQLCLDRCIGEYQLPDGWTVVAASNRSTDRAGANSVITPLLNRFLHIDMEINVSDWLDWAVSGCIDERVRGFIRFKSEMLHQFDASDRTQRSFPSPRSWSFVSNIMGSSVPHGLRLSAIAGCIGQSAASEFAAYCEIYQHLPDPDTVIEQCATHPLPTRPDITFALSGSIAARARDADTAKLEKIVTVFSRLPADHAVAGIQDSIRHNRGVIMTPGCRKWLTANPEIQRMLAGSA